MRNSATVLRRGADLPPDLAAALEGSEAEALYEVRIQKASAEDTAFFLETRAKVQEGVAALEAGEVYSEDEAYRIIFDDGE